MKTDYEALAKVAQSKGYKRNLSSKEIGKLKSKSDLAMGQAKKINKGDKSKNHKYGR